MSLKARTAEASLQVSNPEDDGQGTAQAAHPTPSDGLPTVLATSRMAELMELAASRLMRTHLRDGESSVGIEMNVTFAARTPVSGVVRAVATYGGISGGISGRLHRFTINTFDESGLIGSCEHTRAVVVERRLLALARRRGGKPGRLLMV